MAVDVGAIFIGIIVATLGGTTMLFIRKKYNDWNEYRKERDGKQLLFCRMVECMNYSLMNVGSIGEEYSKLYKERWNTLLEEDKIREKGSAR